MAALTVLAALLAPIADPVARWQPLIAEAARHCGVPERWVAQVMRAESGGVTAIDGHPIRSAKGAMGLMQLMPGTWAQMRVALGLGADPDDPHDNILAGACYLRAMYDRFGYPGLFGAYNAGPARYAAWLAGGRGLPAETDAYLAKLDATRAANLPPAPPLFAVRRGPVSAAPAGPAETQSLLFAIRKPGQ